MASRVLGFMNMLGLLLKESLATPRTIPSALITRPPTWCILMPEQARVPVPSSSVASSTLLVPKPHPSASLAHCVALELLEPPKPLSPVLRLKDTGAVVTSLAPSSPPQTALSHILQDPRLDSSELRERRAPEGDRPAGGLQGAGLAPCHYQPEPAWNSWDGCQPEVPHHALAWSS